MAIKPELSGGFNDYLPEDMIPRQRMFDAIRATFERFGFVPLDTPGMERREVLTGDDPNFKMHIFNVSNEPLAMRFDLTVPLARVIAMYPDRVKKPFKRYQVGKVWRGEKPQAGRFREFVQFDADTVGTASMMADAEIVALIYETMRALGLSQFLIRVNNRKILNGLAAYAGFSPEKTAAVLRTIDKLDKQGWASAAEELALPEKPKADSEPSESEAGSEGGEAAKARWGAGLTASAIEAIKRFIELRTGTQRETLDAVVKLMANAEIAQEGVRELREVADHVAALGVPSDAWAVDLSVARGLGYYTGPVFETILTDLPQIGSVFSGGRYDDLVSRFAPITIPATGASVGVDRLFAAMEQLDLVKREKTTAGVLILNFDPGCATACEETATRLRRAGVAAEVYIGQEQTLKGQLAFAVSQEYPAVIIIGSNERERGVVKVKDMAARTQIEAPQTDVVKAVLDIVGKR